MRINKIELFNIGSYEGINQFDIKGQNMEGNLVLVGGKNGAGKTTVFNSIKLCLYGHKEAGYQNINSFYKKLIKKMINDKAKLENNATGYVELDLSLMNGQEWVPYTLKRCWKLEDSEFETFTVVKNGVLLEDEELVEFENYLMNLIPPELFELYFFDGEQIADFFLEDTNNQRIKNAFLTICGYDTFDILYKNFKRISKNNKTNDDSLMKYLETEDILANAERNVEKSKKKVLKILDDIEMIDGSLESLEIKYREKGGVSIDEWNAKFLDIKNEERIREEKNAWLKTAANDMIPYIILKDELEALQKQMNKEQEVEKKKILSDSIKSMLPEVFEELKADYSQLNNEINQKIINSIEDRISVSDEENILNLSKGEHNTLTSMVTTLLDLDKQEIINQRKAIKQSIKRGQSIKEEIENSSIDTVEAYLKNKEELIQQKNDLVNAREEELEKQKILVADLDAAKAEYERAEKNLDKHLKSQSVESLTARSIKFLEVLQNRLFEKEIRKVESLFMHKMRQLMRKEQFIDKIIIDNEFGVHVYKEVSLKCKKISALISEITEEKYMLEYGKVHCDDILLKTGCESLKEFVEKYQESSKIINVLVEFDKSIMSKGEKQVFIMALYWAMVQLSNKEIPFIIDTPFARIDTEHRGHITEFFFKELKGQLFIFSTDEEITESHMKMMEDIIEAQFLIENIDNKKTSISEKKYFGV